MNEAFEQWARYLRYSRPSESFAAWLTRAGEERIPLSPQEKPTPYCGPHCRKEKL